MSARTRAAGTKGPVRRGHAITPIPAAEIAAGGGGGGGGSTVTLPIDLTTDVTGDLPFANLAQIAGLSVLGVTGSSTADVAAITAASDKQVLRRSGTGLAFGAVDLSSSSAVTGRLTLANIPQGTALSVLGVTGNATADYADIAAGSDGQVLRRSGTALAFGAISLSTAAAVTGKLPWANLADVSATARILARISSGSGVIEEATLSQVLDLITSPAQGDILFRGASSWQRLGTGTSGQFLQSQGPAADLQWGSITGATVGVGAFYTGSGHPQGVVGAAIGAHYVDTATGYVYRKFGGGSTAYGWYPIMPISGQLGPTPWFCGLSGVQAIVGLPRTQGYGYWMNGIGDTGDQLGGSISGATAETYINNKRYHSMATAATSGQLATLNTNTTNPRKILDDDVDVWIDMMTDPSAVTTVRYSFGLSSAAITDTETPGSASNGSIMLRYSTAASDGGWVGSTQKNGAGNTTVSTTIASIAANTLYRLRVRFVRSGTPTAYFSVNDSTEISITTNIPLTGSTYFLVLGIVTKANSARALVWRSMGGSIGS